MLRVSPQASLVTGFTFYLLALSLFLPIFLLLICVLLVNHSLAMILETPQTIKTKHYCVKMKSTQLMSCLKCLQNQISLSCFCNIKGSKKAAMLVRFELLDQWPKSGIRPIGYSQSVFVWLSEGAVCFGQACKAGKRHVASCQTASLWLVDYSCFVANLFVCIVIVSLNRGFCFLTFFF